MFYAFVLACVIGQPDMCFEAADSRGPYPTRELCVARVEEMVAMMPALLPPVPHEFKYKCVRKGAST